MNELHIELQHPIGLAVVTGANGHLGANLVRVLLALGVPVRAVVRPGHPPTALEGLPIEIVEHDMLNPNDWTPLFDGCTNLFHCAALFAFQSKLNDQILGTAIDGTRNILLAATQCRTLEKIVYTSSTVSIGYSYANREVRSETDWNDAPDSSYAKAKTQSELLAWQMAKEYSLPLVVVNPSMILGFYDYRMTPSMAMVYQPLNRTIPFSIPGGLSVVDATDCAVGHVLAGDRGSVGERYILSSESITVVEFYRLISELIGLAPPRVTLGKTTGEILVGFFELGSVLLKKPPLLTRKRFLALYERYGYYSSNKAMRDLGFKPRSARETIVRTIAWFIIGNGISLKRLEKMHLREEILQLLPSGWKPGSKLQLQTNTMVR